ncbi:RAS oncogene family member RabX1 [Arctopsyche grandis]|uniref:RAS oncogene family member RabX1 n=1 Tax=Arctopsyche grandis TaxID=121162 RepID=UPI00406D6AED
MKILQGKVVVLGSQGVGKTSMVVRYVGKMFSTHISPTIGASFFTCKINIGDSRVTLQVWDTAGQERFRSMAPMYYRNASAALLVFDITNIESFQAIKNWVKELRSNVSEPMVLYLVGNKIDLVEERKVSYDDAIQYSRSINAKYYESSALQDQGIEQLFINVASDLLKTSGESINASMQSNDLDFPFEDVLTPSADCSTLQATHIGKTETAPWSIDSIAHADSEKPYMCC